MSTNDGFPSADDLYRAGALSNRMPSAAELFAATSPENDEYDTADFRDDEDEEEPQFGAPAPLTLIPTSTTNPRRPRTLAAGYDKKLQTLTVLFRDNNNGAGPVLYNYYDVDNLTWANFKRARSKGRFIKAYLDDHDRGYPTEAAISKFGRDFLGSVAREYQEAQGGLQPGHSAKSRRGMRPYGSR